MDRVKVERAIDGLTEWQKHVQTNSNIDKNISTAIEALKAQLCQEDATKGTTSDTISRQQAIEALDKRFDNIPMDQTAEILMLRKDLRNLPSVQPDYTEMKQEFLRMAGYIDVLLECSDEQKETLLGFISRMSEFMPWTQED